MTYLTEKQVKLLLARIHPDRVLVRDGMSYVEGYDIRAELNRVFGFGRWSEEVLDQALICETEVKTRGGKDAWYVVYRTRLRLTVNAPDGTYLTRYDGSHVGESTHPVRGEAHGNALTNSETYALRRAAINLGDQFGLSLYNKGSLDPVVRWTLVRPDAEAPEANTDDVPKVSEETGTGSGGTEEESAGEAFEESQAPEPVPAPRDPDEAWMADEARAARSTRPADTPAAGRKWLAATRKVVPQVGKEACRNLWREASEKQHSGELAEADATAVLALIKARVDYLDLPADWQAKVDELSAAEDADPVLAEVFQMLGAGMMEGDLARRIEAVITAKFPQPDAMAA